MADDGNADSALDDTRVISRFRAINTRPPQRAEQASSHSDAATSRAASSKDGHANGAVDVAAVASTGTQGLKKQAPFNNRRPVRDADAAKNADGNYVCTVDDCDSGRPVFTTKYKWA